MNERNTSGVVLIGVFVLALLGYMLLPSLQTSARRNDAQADVHVERARRLLDRYDASLIHNMSVLGLIESSLNLKLGELTEPGKVSDEAEQFFGSAVEEHWNTFGPKERPRLSAKRGEVPRVKMPPAQPVSPPSQLGADVAEFEKELAANERNLADALAEANSALSISANHAEAERIKGAVLYYQALTKLIRSAAVRNEAVAPRAALASLATRISELEKGANVVKESGLDARIAEREARIADVQKSLEKDRADLARLDGEIAGLDKKLADARGRAAAARAALDALREKGVDFSRTDGAEVFADAYAKADQSYRTALREVQALERGSYPNAKIDRTGDYISGAYEENGHSDNLTVEHGLEHRRADRAVLAIAVEGDQKSIESLRTDVEALKAMKARYEAGQKDTLAAIAAAREQAGGQYETLSAVIARADEIETGALSDLAQAASAAQAGAASVDQRVREATSRSATLSPEAKAVSSYEAGRKSGWLTGYVKAQGADAQIAAAWVYVQRAQGRRELAALLEHDGKTLGLPDEDAAAAKTAADEARDQGLTMLTTAMKTLQTAHREAGQPWTITAEAAGATYLAVLLGAENASAYLKDSIEAYRAAIAGREDEPYVAKIQERLAQLEKK